MKFLVHYGLYECEGFKYFVSEEAARKFISKRETKLQRQRVLCDSMGWWWEIFKVESVELVERNYEPV